MTHATLLLLRRRFLSYIPFFRRETSPILVQDIITACGGIWNCLNARGHVHGRAFYGPCLRLFLSYYSSTTPALFARPSLGISRQYLSDVISDQTLHQARPFALWPHSAFVPPGMQPASQAQHLRSALC